MLDGRGLHVVCWIAVKYHQVRTLEKAADVGMSGFDEAELTVVPRRLSSAAFAPFGAVIEHSDPSPRHVIAGAFETDGALLEQVLWVSRIDKLGTLPLQVTAMERHPHSAQFFSPLECGAYLVAVCPELPDGNPDIDALRAFVAVRGQGVVYRRNVWHHPMVALGTPAVFAVSMAKGCTDDDVFAAVRGKVVVGAMPFIWADPAA